MENNLNVNDLLKYIAENDMIDLSYVQEQVKMKRREEILKRHHYTIWHSEKEDVWYTYLPDNSKANNRKKIKRKSKRDLEDIIYDYYLSVPDSFRCGNYRVANKSYRRKK